MELPTKMPVCCVEDAHKKKRNYSPDFLVHCSHYIAKSAFYLLPLSCHPLVGGAYFW
jgi:hypothetical protein